MADNLFQNLPVNLAEELFETLAESGAVKIERIVSNGHCDAEGSWQSQSKNEWVIVLKGAAIIAFEYHEVNLKEGDYLSIPAEKKHRVQWTQPKTETVWLAVHYS